MTIRRIQKSETVTIHHPTCGRPIVDYQWGTLAFLPGWNLNHLISSKGPSNSVIHCSFRCFFCSSVVILFVAGRYRFFSKTNGTHMQCLVIRGIKECGLNIERTCYQTLWHWRCCQAQRGICRRLRHFWQLLRLKIVWPKLKFLCEKWLKKGTFGHISHQTVQAQKKNDFL